MNSESNYISSYYFVTLEWKKNEIDLDDLG